METDIIWIFIILQVFAIGLIPIAYFGIVGTNEAIDHQTNYINHMRGVKKMSDYNWCHGPDCHTYTTSSRVRGSKGNKV